MLGVFLFLLTIGALALFVIGLFNIKKIYLFLKYRNSPIHEVYNDVIYWEKGDEIIFAGSHSRRMYKLYSIEKNGIWVEKYSSTYSFSTVEDIMFIPLYYNIQNLDCEERMRKQRADGARKDGSYQEFLKILKDEYQSFDEFTETNKRVRL